MRFFAAVLALFAVLIAQLSISTVAAAENAGKRKEDFIIKGLPGLQETPPFKMYSGFIESGNLRTFFYLAEAEKNPSEAPLVLWQSGGPGCSSLAAWAIENGPFTMSSDGKSLKLAESRWNKEANMLFVESPIGVGYTHSLDPRDYQIYNDNKTASDVYNFLINFYEVFDEYKTRDFYIAAESYGGHYGVVIAREIHIQNQKSAFKVNLQGFLIGNGLTDNNNDRGTGPEWLYQHTLISLDQYKRGLEACKGDFVRNAHLRECSAMLQEYYSQIDNINPYAIYATCEGIGLPKLSDGLFNAARGFKEGLVTYFQADDGRVRASAPCIDGSGMEEYFNRPEVRSALNAQSSQAQTWEFCNMKINRMYDWTWDSMIPFIRELSPHYRALYYSGDTDYAVNVMGTQKSLYEVGQKVVEKFRQWHLPGSRQVAGMIQRWEHITFVTVLGAGHMCPHETMGKPVETLYMFNQFLKNKKFD